MADEREIGEALTIRPASADDVEAIAAIYNDAVIKTTANFDTEPPSLEEHQTWFHSHGEGYPVIVSESGGAVVGWASLTPYSTKGAYKGTVEFSIYVAEACRGRGIGKKLMAAAMEAGERAGLRTVIARITTDNALSLRLHEQAGFETVGVYRKVGMKFGKLLDVCHMQRFFYPYGND